MVGNKNSLSFGLFDKNELIAISLGRIKHWCGTGVFRKISGRVICNENAVFRSGFSGLRAGKRQSAEQMKSVYFMIGVCMNLNKRLFGVNQTIQNI